jgi:quinol monooxygenase YgiN
MSIRSLIVPRPALMVLALTGAAMTFPMSLPLAQTATGDGPVATIRADADHLTMINVFTPTVGTQDEVVDAIEEGLVSVSEMPGFIRSTVHRSRDSATVVVYAQWQDQASVDAAVAAIRAGAAPAMLRALTIARSELHPFDVLSVHSPQEG